MRLVGVEVRRVLARRLVAAVALVGIVAVGLVLATAWQQAQPLSPEQLEQAEREYDRYLTEWEENHQQWHESCLTDQERESELQGEPVDFGCEHNLERPEREWFVPQSNELADSYSVLLSSSGLLPLLLVLLVGVTSTAAEMSTGSMSTWLTFVPRRMRVLASKLGAAAVVGVPVTALLTGLLVGGFWAVHRAHDALGDLTAQTWADVGWVSLRLVAAGALVAAVGAALGVLLRHTGVVLGLVIGWALVVESILGSGASRLQPYLLLTNLRGWIEGGTTYWRMECEVTSQGTSCQGVEEALSLAHSSVFLAVVSAVLIAVTALVFRRRDVA